MVGLGFGVAALLAVVMAAAWGVQRRTGNAGWVDAFWSFGTGLGGAVAALWPLAGPPDARQWLVAVLAAAWGVRLGAHITARTLSGQREDVRYARLRRDWGDGFQARMFGFLMVQALAAWVLTLAMLVAARNPSPGLGWADAIGVIVLGAAVAGEGLADRQMQRFRADPANKGGVMRRGLWAWSRHPNYFFQTLGWLAYVVIALGPPGSPWWGVLAVPAPVFMYWLLVYVSGVPPLEREMLGSRGDAWRAYQAETSVFFPLPPRRQAGR